MCSYFILLFIISFLSSIVLLSAQSRCQNEPNGTQLPMPNSRVTYLLCLNGLENVRSCQSGREFNPFDRRCLAMNADTQPIPVSRPNICFNHPDGTRFADPSSRNRFIYCENGIKLNGECSSNQVFNQNTSTCEIQRTRPAIVTRPTARPPLNAIRVTTLRSGFAGLTRPTPRPNLQRYSSRPNVSNGIPSQRLVISPQKKS